jgi:hypothetical protein
VTDARADALEAERFRRPGSDKLWTALLGWDEPRRARTWLVQAVHDGARGEAASSDRAAQVVAQFGRRRAEAAAELDEASVAIAVDLWRASPRDDASEPAAKWQYLSNLGRRAGLGDSSPEEQRNDWLIWTRLEAASAPRIRLMNALEEAERAALELCEVTESDPAQRVAQMTRVLWSALAYGDNDAFRRLSAWSLEWLARTTVPEGEP